MKRIIYFSKKDNVATVLDDIKKGQRLFADGKQLVVREDIPYGHKVALVDIKKGNEVYKYGEKIAKATADIVKGSWVHVHNVESIRGLGR